MVNALTKISKVPIEYQDIDGGNKGYFSLKDRKIVVQKDMTQVPLMKSEMVAAAFEILMEAYIGSLGRCSTDQKVTITIKSYNRYIKFPGFREYFDVCLYKSGDIDINMRESCHAGYLERIYEYKEDRAQQEAFLEKLKDGFTMQIMDVATYKLICLCTI